MPAAKGRRLWGLLALLLVVAIATPAAASIPRDTLLEPDPQALLAAVASVDETPELAAPAVPVVRFIPLQEQLGDRFELLPEAALDRLVRTGEPQQLHLFAEPETRLRASRLLESEQPQGIQWFGWELVVGEGVGPNLYGFALNNPASFSDPMGLATLQEALDDGELLAAEIPDLELTPWEVDEILGSQTAYVPADPGDPQATERNLRRAKYVLLFRNRAFRQYVDALYNLSRGLNPPHFVFETAYAMQAGYEPVKGIEINSGEKALELITYFTVLKGAQWTNRWLARFAPEESSSVLSRGAVRTTPRNLAERLALDEAKGGAGKRIMQGKINDPRYPEGAWAKMQHVHENPDGTRAVIHYWQNLQTGAREGFKFK